MFVLSFHPSFQHDTTEASRAGGTGNPVTSLVQGKDLPRGGLESRNLLRYNPQSGWRIQLYMVRNFRLLNRLLAQMERLLEINSLREMTKDAVAATRESMLIGQV
ncbi:MAG: hypothetical protein WA324_29065 [Bryobacteraceae bacterium]